MIAVAAAWILTWVWVAGVGVRNLAAGDVRGVPLLVLAAVALLVTVTPERTGE